MLVNFEMRDSSGLVVMLWTCCHAILLILKLGVDELLARHYAHLFIRDPLVIFRELLDQDDQTSTDHFEVISKQF